MRLLRTTDRIRLRRAAAAGLLTAAGAAALLGVTATAAAAAPAQPAAPVVPMTPLSQSGEYQVVQVADQNDLLNSDKAIVIGGGDVRATSVDGQTFHYYRVVDGARSPLVASAPVCLPTGACHIVLSDNQSPVV
ncbi:hypothetical protein G4X40_03800 [Rhodococcus sp. D2-41]|uniref:Secreted protein n=1 Tax=Speluncibacter jeojiensis TaxID=2710754 RepID=A0A9X4REX9_9ACTN|nr:hypothetical protein [Rhodococcus sp. D2-41]MDG3009267.1 hypothetical protein [Rhodococcus sp. D2-41]MDG3016058.1 hypothetical protein [Corynebacteriales bacterium D3-21]